MRAYTARDSVYWRLSSGAPLLLGFEPWSSGRRAVTHQAAKAPAQAHEHAPTSTHTRTHIHTHAQTLTLTHSHPLTHTYTRARKSTQI